MREAPERPYSCDDCGERYSQRQGVSRHRRKAHSDPHSCCVPRCKFKWILPYLYRAHLKKWHSDVNPDKVLGKHAGCRRRSMIIGRDLPQQFPLPVIEPDRRSRAEPLQHPMTPPLPVVANVTRLPSPAMLPVSYGPRPEYAEPTISTYEHEDARKFDASSAISPTEACTYWHSMNDFDAFTYGEQIWLDMRFYTPLM